MNLSELTFDLSLNAMNNNISVPTTTLIIDEVSHISEGLFNYVLPIAFILWLFVVIYTRVNNWKDLLLNILTSLNFLFILQIKIVLINEYNAQSIMMLLFIIPIMLSLIIKTSNYVIEITKKLKT